LLQQHNSSTDPMATQHFGAHNGPEGVVDASGVHDCSQQTDLPVGEHTGMVHAHGEPQVAVGTETHEQNTGPQSFSQQTVSHPSCTAYLLAQSHRLEISQLFDKGT